MLIRNIAIALVVGGLGFGLIGCGGSNSKSAGYQTDFEDSSVGVKPVGRFDGENISPEEEMRLLNTKVIYFAYDDAQLSAQDQRVLFVHARHMVDNPKLRLRIAGHTDERGSREYNIALGERRGLVAKRFMESNGVACSRITVVSYGKEQPADLGTGEAAWAKNRRDELHYEDVG